MKTLDQNTIIWTIISPMSKKTYAFNKVTANGFGKPPSSIKNQVWKFHANMEKAHVFIEELKTKGTQFAVFFITDKQFGEMKISYAK